ncbi:sodium:calcium antiporter [Pseudoflavitalea rhizosphaerae]|uniref:sodium:calcium antiporter n=1 Tax=Pseudoflavitalea rhizosphaerae TaxID=1884793 RepID=UPI000F8C6E0A|nr:sodium:calcium antiporter [Pseudoflavitalea rhizosphaerae]
MENLYLNISGFILCAAVIIFSGSKLSFYGDKIAELTGMGKAWVGLIIMASVTSLPELITGISSVAIVKVPDLAAGDIFGSCVFNLLILSVLDARVKRPLLSEVKSSHIVAAIFGIILLTVAGMAIYLSDQVPGILWMSSFTFLIFAIYLIAVWGIYKYEHASLVESPPSTVVLTASRSAELRRAVGNYALNALVVIGAAVFLPFFGENIAARTGLGNSFFGTLFIAAATSLPELVVSLAALRIGALDMAVGNLLGSNVFNMFILGVDDVFYRQGSIFRNISSSHLISVFITILMTTVVGLGLLFKPKKKHLWLLSLDTFIILFLYLVLMIYLFAKK